MGEMASLWFDVIKEDVLKHEIADHIDLTPRYVPIDGSSKVAVSWRKLKTLAMRLYTITLLQEYTVSTFSFIQGTGPLVHMVFLTLGDFTGCST